MKAKRPTTPTIYRICLHKHVCKDNYKLTIFGSLHRISPPSLQVIVGQLENEAAAGKGSEVAKIERGTPFCCFEKLLSQPEKEMTRMQRQRSNKTDAAMQARLEAKEHCKIKHQSIFFGSKKSHDIGHAVVKLQQNSYMSFTSEEQWPRTQGALALIVTDREGVPIVKVSRNDCPDLAMRGSFLATFPTATEQASKLGLSKNKNMICMYSSHQVVMFNFSPLVVTVIAQSSANTGMILSLESEFSVLLNDLKRNIQSAQT
eukprot:gene16903-18609_t